MTEPIARHPNADLTDTELRQEIFKLSAQIGDHVARIQYGDPSLADAYRVAVDACNRLRDDAIRRLRNH